MIDKGSLTLNLCVMRTRSIFQVAELPFRKLEPTKVRHELTGFLGFLGGNLDNVNSPRQQTPFDPVPSEKNPGTRASRTGSHYPMMDPWRKNCVIR